MSVQLPPCPPTLKPIQHHLKTAVEHDGRDPVVSYWCRLCALQSALKIDKKSDEAKMFLMSLMDWLENTKKSMHDNESVMNEVAAHAYIENYALKIFTWADSQDRAGVFNKNVVKAFYTAGMLMDVLTVFGELTEEITANRKYAKWKAAYIHNCLKNGEMPVPGPMKSEDSNEDFVAATNDSDGPSTSGQGYQPGFGFQFDQSDATNLPDPPSTLGFSGLPNVPSFPAIPETSSSGQNIPSHSNYNVTPTPAAPQPTPCVESASDTTTGAFAQLTGTPLGPEQITKAQKYCKWAISALNYDDIKEAVSNLEKALTLLQTGIEKNS